MFVNNILLLEFKARCLRCYIISQQVFDIDIIISL